MRFGAARTPLTSQVTRNMWQPIETSIASRPERDVSIACAVRQLLRARDADDGPAIWIERHFLGLQVTSLAEELLPAEPSWNSDGRWLDGMRRTKVAIGSPSSCLISGGMIWGFRDNVGGPQWAEPIECELQFSLGFAKLTGATLRFGDRRSFPEERLQDSLGRIPREIESNSIQWAFLLQYTGQ